MSPMPGNPKHEIRNPKQIQMLEPKIQNEEAAQAV
jgi:hypothetical protein